MRRFTAPVAITLVTLLASACSSEVDDVDTGSDAVSATSGTAVHVGPIERGASQPGRFQLGVRDAADSAANTLFFARAAAHAYRDGAAQESELAAATEELGLERYFFFDAKFAAAAIDRPARQSDESGGRDGVPDAQGFVGLVTPRDAPREKAVVIGYRGTDSLRDALTDAWVTKTPSEEYGAGEGIEVHSGFKAQTKILWDAIEAQVWELVIKPASMRKDAADAFWPVYFTGHSLGGAVAVVAAARVVSPKSDAEIEQLRRRFGAPPPASGQGYPIGGIYTFGQPRVGNQAFVDALRRRLSTLRRFQPEGAPYVRYYNGGDVVGRVPVFGYVHGGLEIRLGDATTQCSAWEDPFRPGYSISDHYMQSYLAAADAAVARATASRADRLCGP